MSDLKRSRGVSPKSDESKDSLHEDEDTAAIVNKKLRDTPVNTVPTLTEIHTTSDFNGKIRSAIDLNRAIARATTEISSIGHSLTTYEEKNPPSEEHQRVLDDLRNLYKEVPLPYRHGVFQEPFHFTVTRLGCEYDGNIGHNCSVSSSELEKWYENGAIAGYGDIKTLQTKVDAEVRDAREILASEFTVEPKFLERIRDTWVEGFIPGNVRVEPYKVHIYGEGGHFKYHRDTPDHSLVGTFIVGLGDSSYDESDEGNFCIGNKKLHSPGGSWVAFHPDVPHSVSALESYEYRAVIAFKIFRNGDPVEHEAATREAALQQRVGAVLNKIPVPYGMLLDHKYPMGVQGLNGFDAIMLSAAEQRQGTVIHILPVLIESRSEVYFDSEYREDEGYENEFVAEVIPITRAHVDLLLTTDEDVKQQATAQIEFLEDISEVPFYSRMFEDAAERWKEEKRDINWTGNESDGERESSIYLSYALLVLPYAASV